MKSRGFTRQPSEGQDGGPGSPPYFARWSVYDVHEDKSHFSNPHRKSHGAGSNTNDSYGNHNNNNNNGNDEEPGRWWPSGEDELSATSSVLNVHVREKHSRPTINYTVPLQQLVGGAGIAKHNHQAVNIPLFMEDDEDEDENAVGGIAGNDVVIGDSVIGCGGGGGGHKNNSPEEKDAENKEDNWLDYYCRYNCKGNNSCGFSGENVDYSHNYNRNNSQYSHVYSTHSAYGRIPMTSGDADAERGDKRKAPATTPTITVPNGEWTQSFTGVSGAVNPQAPTGATVYTASRMRYKNANSNDGNAHISNVYNINAVSHGSGTNAGKALPPVRQTAATAMATSSASSTIGFEAAAASIIAAAGLPLGTLSLANYIMEGQPRLPSRQPVQKQQQGGFDRNHQELTLKGNPMSSPVSPPPYCYSSMGNTSSLKMAHFSNATGATNNTCISVWTGKSWGNEQNSPFIQIKHAQQPTARGGDGQKQQQQQQQQTKAYSEYLSDLLYFHADFFPPPSPPRGLPFPPSYDAAGTTTSSLYSLSQLSPYCSSCCGRRAALWYHYASKWNITHRLPPPPRTPLPEMREQEESRRRRKQQQQQQQQQQRQQQQYHYQQQQHHYKVEGEYVRDNRQGLPCTPYDISGWMKMCERWFDVAQRQFNYPPENIPVRVSPGFVLRHVALC